MLTSHEYQCDSWRGGLNGSRLTAFELETAEMTWFANPMATTATQKAIIAALLPVSRVSIRDLAISYP